MALGVARYVDHNGALCWGTHGWTHWKPKRKNSVRTWFGKRLPSGVRFRDPAKPVTYRVKGERVKPSQEPRPKHTRTQKRREDKWFKAKRRLAHKRSQRKSYPNPWRAHPRWHRKTQRITWEMHAIGSEWKGAAPG